MSRALKYLIAAAAACLVIGCSSARSWSGEAEASAATFQWVTARYQLVNNPELAAMLERVVERLARVCIQPTVRREIDRLALGSAPAPEDILWQIFVIDDPEANAYSAGAGLILVTRGMMLQTESEAELVAVISHEMAHQLLGHTREALARAKENTAERGASAPMFSLQDELAADSLSIHMLYGAGYRLNPALRSLSIGYRRNHSSVDQIPPPWLSERMARLHQLIARQNQAFLSTDNSREFNRVRRILLNL